MKIGQKIKKIREFKNFTQEYVAFEIGLSQSAYSKIEQGETELTLTRLKQISVVFEMSPEDILTFNGNFLFSDSHEKVKESDYNRLQSMQSAAEQYEMQLKWLRDEVSYLRDLVKRLVNNEES
jgi:transcriptional regulator with XRE-family HTH domain